MLLVCLFVYPCATHRSGSCPSQLLQVLPLDGSTAHHRLFGSSTSSGSQRIKHKEQRPNVVMANLAHFGRLVALFFHNFVPICCSCSLEVCVLHLARIHPTLFDIWYFTLCIVNQRFEGVCCLHHEFRRIGQAWKKCYGYREMEDRDQVLEWTNWC